MIFSRSIIVAAAAAALSAAVTFSATAGSHTNDPAVGTWWNVSKNAQITIAPCGKNSLCGNISWMKEPNREDGTPKRDINNDDRSLQDRTILGMQIIGGFENEGIGEWDDGEIYNPEDGNTYSSNMKVNADGNLQVEGCVLFICKEQVWTPVQQ